MKFIKTFKLYKEENEFDVKDTDSDDKKMSKEKLNDFNMHLSEYNSKKSKIDDIYKKGENISDELEKLLGKEDRNTFLVSYTSIASLKKKIEDIKNNDDKVSLEISDFKSRLNDASDENKLKISNRIKELEQKRTDLSKEMQEVNKKMPELEKELKDKIEKQEKDIQEWIKKI